MEYENEAGCSEAGGASLRAGVRAANREGSRLPEGDAKNAIMANPRSSSPEVLRQLRDAIYVKSRPGGFCVPSEGRLRSTGATAGGGWCALSQLSERPVNQGFSSDIAAPSVLSFRHAIVVGGTLGRLVCFPNVELRASDSSLFFSSACLFAAYRTVFNLSRSSAPTAVWLH